MSLLKDETGSLSSARVGFWVWTVFTIAIIIARMAGAPDPGNAVWSLVGGVFIALIGWAGGPRIMAYLAPQIGAMTKAIGDARAALPGKHDDERGPPQ